jgi:L-iditol 2-dehydrogenase
MKMNAAFLEGIEKIVLRSTDIPKPGPNEALLEVESCTVCGSDLKIYHNGNPRLEYPVIVGHELAGTVVEAGKEVRAVAVGDRVAVGADIPAVWNSNVPGKSEYIDYAVGHEFDGGFAEYMLLNEKLLNYGPVTHITDSLPGDGAAIAEPLACALKGLELAQFGAGKSICVIGLGPIGVMALELSRAFGAGKIFAAQRSRRRIELARQIIPEARYIATEEEDLTKVIMDETGGLGLDCVITAVSSVQAQEAAIQIVGHGGYVNLFGGLKGKQKLCIDPNNIHYKECYIMGSHGSHPRHHKLAVKMIENGYINWKKYISKRFSLTDIKAAYEYYDSRQGLKVAVDPKLR